MTINETDLNAAADRLVQRDVILCLSSMVATLATGAGIDPHQGRGAGARIDLANLCEQAVELSSPVLDYEEAARQAGWKPASEHPDHYDAGTTVWVRPCILSAGEYTQTGLYEARDAHDACEDSDLDPYEWEIFEHWAVSPWLAEKLAAEGERVDTDFAGLNVWGRTTTGQAISMDAVIRKIAADMLKAA